MKIINRLAAVLGVFGVTSSVLAGYAPPTAAQAAQSAAQLVLLEQRECREALLKNTIEALEAFLAKYPKSKSGCRALALNALGQFQPGESGPGEKDNNPGGYGG